MQSAQIFAEAKQLLENNRAFSQLFLGLPTNAEIRVILDNRINCVLKKVGDQLALTQQEETSADLELKLFSESIRRLTDADPKSVFSLLKELGSLSLREQAKVRLRSSPKELYKKGYLHALKAVGPTIKRDLSVYALNLLGRVNSARETLLAMLKK